MVPPVASSDDATAAEVSGSGISASVEATATREDPRRRAGGAPARGAREGAPRGGARRRQAPRRRGGGHHRAGRHEGRAEPRRHARRRRFKEATESGACFVATRRDRARGGTAASGVRPGARALAGGARRGRVGDGPARAVGPRGERASSLTRAAARGGREPSSALSFPSLAPKSGPGRVRWRTRGGVASPTGPTRHRSWTGAASRAARPIASREGAVGATARVREPSI